MLTALLVVLIVIGLVHLWLRRQRNPYREGHGRYQKQIFVTDVDFTGESLAGFKVSYRLELRFDRVDNAQFDLHKMLDESSQRGLANTFNTNVFRRLMAERSWFFSYAFNPRTLNVDKAFAAPICGLVEEDGGLFVKELPDWQVMDEVRKTAFRGNGCEVYLEFLARNIFNPQIIKENYAMLSKEHKAAILASDRYGQYEEMLAVAALKRRLDFLGNKHQLYKTDGFNIQTERAGNGLKINWFLNDSAKRGNVLFGFRRTGGFFSNQFDESNNGELIVHSESNGETVEVLKEAEANFYTFFLKPRAPDATHLHWSPLRFQVTIGNREEMAEIESIIGRAEERLVGSGSQNVSRALKELGVSMEFDNVIGERVKVLERQIVSSDGSPDEKEEKLSRLREVAAMVRDKYQI